MDERQALTGGDACERLGELAAAATPAQAQASDLGQWAAIEQRLERRRWWPNPRVLAWSSLALVVVIAATSTWLGSRRHLAFRIDSCTTAAGGALVSDGAGKILFTDGSRIGLGAGARARIDRVVDEQGAELSLEEGEVTVSVVHRTGSRWAVRAGPYRVEVTGTRFVMNWSAAQGRLRVRMQEGGVRVSGGSLSAPTMVRAGETLDSLARPVPADPGSASPASIAPDVPAQAPTPPPSGTAVPSPHERRPATPRQPKADPARAGVVGQVAASPATHSVSPSAERFHVADDLAIGSSEPDRRPSPSSPSSGPTASSAPPVPARQRITIASDGTLGGGMTGIAWVTRGSGTALSTSIVPGPNGRLLPKDGELCANGRMAALRCVNENLPQARCDWDHNWGVAIGISPTASGGPWGAAAAGALAVEFHGRANRYRLTAHRSGDPPRRMFCVEDYRSGQVVRPEMFKSECWADRGESLADFRNVDLFNLELPSGNDYTAFRYCISGVELVR